MRPATVDLHNHTAGDTWEGITVGPVEINEAAPSGAVDSCRMSFRSKSNKTLGQTLSSGTEITIDDADTWEFTVDPIILTMEAGSYDYDFEVTDVTGVVRTIYKGTFNLILDTTNA